MNVPKRLSLCITVIPCDFFSPCAPWHIPLFSYLLLDKPLIFFLFFCKQVLDKYFPEYPWEYLFPV